MKAISALLLLSVGHPFISPIAAYKGLLKAHIGIKYVC